MSTELESQVAVAGIHSDMKTIKDALMRIEAKLGVVDGKATDILQDQKNTGGVMAGIIASQTSATAVLLDIKLLLSGAFETALKGAAASTKVDLKTHLITVAVIAVFAFILVFKATDSSYQGYGARVNDKVSIEAIKTRESIIPLVKEAVNDLIEERRNDNTLKP